MNARLYVIGCMPQNVTVENAVLNEKSTEATVTLSTFLYHPSGIISFGAGEKINFDQVIVEEDGPITRILVRTGSHFARVLN